jgi:hypothetical protein
MLDYTDKTQQKTALDAKACQHFDDISIPMAINGFTMFWAR